SGGSENDTFSRLRVHSLSALVSCNRSLRSKLREPEINHLGTPLAANYNVCRLDISVNNASDVSGRERIRNLNPQIEGLGDAEASFAHEHVESLPFYVLHNDEWFIVIGVDFVYRDNSRMVQSRSRFCLSNEAP